MNRLKRAWMRINEDKSTFAANSIEYLGYLLTREGIKPVPKKVQAILDLSPPSNVKELCRVLGVIQYYRDLWGKFSHLLTLLTDLVGECEQTKTQLKSGTKTAKWYWNETHQETFDVIKKLVTSDVMLAYPNFDLAFKIYNNASLRQMGFCNSAKQ